MAPGSGVPLRSATIGKPEGIGGGHECPLGRRDVSIGDPKHRHRAVGSGERTASGSVSARWKYGNISLKLQPGLPSLGPAVIVGGGATQPDAAVHRRRAADDPRAGQREWIVGVPSGEGVAPAVQSPARRWSGRAAQAARRSDRSRNRDRPPAARLTVQVFGQPVGEDAPSRAGADEDRVVLGAARLHSCQVRPAGDVDGRTGYERRPRRTGPVRHPRYVPRRLHLDACRSAGNDVPPPVSTLPMAAGVTECRGSHAVTYDHLAELWAELPRQEHESGEHYRPRPGCAYRQVTKSDPGIDHRVKELTARGLFHPPERRTPTRSSSVRASTAKEPS